MKKVLLSLAIFLIAPFSVHAATIYQQLSDSSVLTSLNSPSCSQSSGYTYIGSVTPTQTFSLRAADVSTSSRAFYILHVSSGTATDVSFLLSSSTGATTTTPGEVMSWSNPSEQYPSGADYFVTAVRAQNNSTLIGGHTYGAYVCRNGGASASVANSASGVAFYGYITDNGGNSLPIVAGIPGFSNTGIATSSLGSYCNGSFSTTSANFFSQLASDFGVAMCNAGVFLFFPDSNTVTSFFALGSTTQSRFPFSWFFDVHNILVGYTASSTENFPSLSIEFGSSTSALGFSTLEVISTTTMAKYLSDANRNLFKTLLAYLVFLLVAAYIYRDIQSIWNKPARDPGGI